MKEKPLSDQISQLMNETPEIAPEAEQAPSPVEEATEAEKDILVDSLKAAAGQSGGALDAALDEFLGGKGVLHEATRSALTRGGGTGLNEVIKILTSQFKLSPAVAKIIAAMIMKLQSSGSKETEKETAAKKKPRRKSKPKAATPAKSSAKKAKKKTTAKAKKTAAKKKTTSKTKPRSSAKKAVSKTAAKKKTSTKTAKKGTKAKAKPKKAKRTSTVEIPE